jgi:YVTN family beta-propeller protein
MRRLFSLLLLVAGCNSAATQKGAPVVSSSIALTSDDRALWVVNQDSDSVSVLDPASRKLVAEVALGAAPAVDPTTMRFDPAVRPRALALTPDDKKVYVAGQTANRVFVLDAVKHSMLGSIVVGAEPTAVVVSSDGDWLYVVNHQSATVMKVDAHKDQVVATLAVETLPWGASLSADGKSLYVTQFLLPAAVSVIDTATFKVRNVVTLADQPPDTANGKTIPNGVARGLYSAVPRPFTATSGGDVWVPHMLLAVKTSEPDLDFQSTVFPTISTLTADGKSEGPRLLFKPLGFDVPGSFSDVVSGPRALAFTPDGSLALMADSGSEDVIAFDGNTGDEKTLVRPLPATMLEGIVVDHAGKKAYVDGRNTHNVVVLDLTPGDPITPVSVDGTPMERLAGKDPMPDDLRQGQRLFYSANSAAFPITQNFWVSCSSCHLEGQTDAVTWLFFVGPRDTPSNAGGPINTGFLLRQALRNSIVDYDTTINLEQGGTFHRTNPALAPLLTQLAAFANYAIPFPQNPNRAADGTLTAAQASGKIIFDARCGATCHAGDYLTDSGSGNPTLDENGPIVLHDIQTCVTTGSFPDQPAPDEVDGNMHTACDFDTPTLRGIFATPPYFHDGSAATLLDAVNRVPAAQGLSDDDKSNLVEYLKTL